MHRHASVNRIYRLVWSHASNGWVPAAETTRGRGKGSCRALLAATLSLAAGLTDAGPLSGQVVSGSGRIGQSGALTTITQTSPVLSLSWASFNIAPQETVDFVQPAASSIAVNRITGTNGTQILGHLNANGQVYLINPNGIVFGRGAQVDVGGLVASTLDVNDASLGGDARTFSGTGSGSVINQGTINATGDGSGGYVALLGNHVVNQGTIRAQLGTVAMGAGSAATLTFQGDSLVHLQVDRSVLNSVAANGGLIRADGGQVLLSAGAKDALLASVVNNTGVIEARTVQEHAGTITLLGGMADGTVHVAGTLDASAPNGGNGGFIETSAAHVEVANSAKITTAAAHGLTGSWLIDPTDFNIAPTGGDETGAQLSTSLGSGNVSIQSSSGGSGTAGNINVNDTVAWSANALTLVAQNNININIAMNGSGSATLALQYGQAAANANNTSVYNINAPVTLPAGAHFSTKLGSDGTVANFTVITGLGAAGDATAAPATPTLQGMAATANLATNFALGTNIDATTTSSWNAGQGFSPIGTNANPFNGSFDGLGHTISNLSITRNMYYVGLFGEVGSTGIVRNTGMLGGSVHGGGYYDGILAGRNFGSISDSYTTGSLTGTSNSIGGLVGGNNGTVSNSYSTATIGGANNTGGLVGINYGSISNSYATGAVAGGYDVGGLLGFNRSGTATNVYSTGAVNGIANIGGLAGQNNGTVSNSYAAGNAHGTGATIAGLVGNNYGTVSDSYALGRVTGSSNLNGVANGGTVNNSFWNITTSGLATSARGTGLTTSQMQTADNFTGFGFTTTPGSAGNAWVMVDIDGGFNNAGGYVGGQHYNSVPGATFPMLTSEYSTVIVNAHQLQLVALAPGASYTLAANIDASATALGGASGGDVWSTTGGFFPIGTGQMGGFTGSFDGLGHTISNLTMAWPAELAYVGLFGNAQPGSIIKNVGLIAASVTVIGVSGFSQPANGTGALVGTNQGSISNSYATGTVSGSSYVGGLVGNNYGALSNASISNSHATVAVSGTSRVGGLTGGNYGSEGSITNSYATGAVVGSSTAGGLVGWNNASIANSYATGNVSDGMGTGIIGGLVGNNYGSIANSYATGTATGNINVGGLVGANSGSIANAYATGNVTGNSYVGGLVGVNMSSIANAYATGDVSGSGSVGGLVGYNHAGISNTYATGNVVGSAYVGGLVGTNLGSISDSFWNSDVFTIGVGADGGGAGTFTGGGGLSAVEMHEMSSFAAWSISNSSGNDVWQIYEGSTAPLLSSFLTPLTVTASNASTVFNGVGFIGNGVTYSVTPNGNLLGTLSYGAAQDAVGAGSYAITPAGLYSTQQGYSITVASATLTIAPLALTGSISAGSSVYGAPLIPGAVTFMNVVFGYTAVTSPITISTAGNLSTSGHLKAGSYSGIESAGSTLSGLDAGDYTFAGAAGDYTVSKLALTGSIVTGSSVYGSALAPGAVSFANAIGADAVTAAAATVTTTNHISSSGHFTAGSHLGSESVGNTLSGADAGDYTFTGATGDYIVTPLALTGAIATGNSIYGSALTPGAATFSNAIANDLLGAAAVNVNTTGLVSTSGNLTAGTHSGVEAVTALSGADGANYTFAAPTGSYTVSPLALTGSIAAGSSVYGSALAPGAVSFANAIGADAVTAGAATVSTTNHVSSSGHFTAGTHLGSESVSGALSGADASDYTFAGATGDYIVTPLALTVAATGANKVYDGTTSDAPTLSGGGVMLGDHVSFADTAANFAGKNVGGGQAVTVSGITLGGADAADYALNSSSAMATATISPASLTVSGIAAGNKVYDGNAAAILAGGSLVGVVAGDTGLVVLTDAGNFASQNVGTGLRVAAAETLSGAGAGNYVLVQPTGLIANITPATLIYEATPASRTAGQSLTGFSGSLSGFVAGETQVNDTIGTLAWTTPANAASRAGRYAIEGSGLTAANYVFVEAPGNAAALTLQPAAVPVPPVPSTPSLPVAALSAIAGLQAAVLTSSATEPSDSLDQSVTLSAAPDADGGIPGALASAGIDSIDSIGSTGDLTASSWDEHPVADTQQKIGTAAGFLHIVNGGVRLAP